MNRSKEGREALVATSGPGDRYRNTLVVSDIELVIPLEDDLDGDSGSPDSVRLVHEDGAYEAVLTSGDPGVERDGDNPLCNYRFQFVPPGRYRVDVKVGDDWYPVISGLHVRRDGIFIGDRNAEGQTDGTNLGTPDPDLTYDLPEYPEGGSEFDYEV